MRVILVGLPVGGSLWVINFGPLILAHLLFISTKSEGKHSHNSVIIIAFQLIAVKVELQRQGMHDQKLLIDPQHTQGMHRWVLSCINGMYVSMYLHN
jgi:hypothetical protein